jgi:maltose O-acetyltransferase
MKEAIRRADPNEGKVLTEIAFSAKKTWDYPPEYFEWWSDELTITKKHIERSTVFVYERNTTVGGFYSLVSVDNDFTTGNVLVKKGYWLEHLFILPSFQHQGIGRMLINHVIEYCKESGISVLKVFVDPHAAGFYEKMGAIFIENSPSSIEGREIPIFRFVPDQIDLLSKNAVTLGKVISL